MTLLDKETLFGLYVPEPPSLIVRRTSDMLTHRMKIDVVDTVFMSFKGETLLKFEIWVQAPDPD